MKGICPNCEKITELEHIKTYEELTVRGEPIKVKVEYYKCNECGKEFEDPGSKDDPLDRAYREYRRKHGMIQPEEIREMRKLYGLTQKELTKLVGWGEATLSRYENGALQDDAHDRVLQLIKNPENKPTERTNPPVEELKKGKPVVGDHPKDPTPKGKSVLR